MKLQTLNEKPYLAFLNDSADNEDDLSAMDRFRRS